MTKTYIQSTFLDNCLGIVPKTERLESSNSEMKSSK